MELDIGVHAIGGSGTGSLSCSAGRRARLHSWRR